MSPEQLNLARRCGAELLGTALLVTIGVGAAVLAPGLGQAGVAFAFGLALLVLAYAIGPISGCQINPAVTLGMALAGRIPPKEAAAYVGAQVVGGIAGAALVLSIATGRAGYSLSADGLGANGWGDASAGGYGMSSALIAEIVLTAVLVFVVISVTATDATAAVAGIPIGLALVLAHLVAIPIDGTSVNPARSIGPALFVGDSALSQLWLFVVAPLVGALVAVGLHRLLALAPLVGRPDGINADPTADPGVRTAS